VKHLVEIDWIERDTAHAYVVGHGDEHGESLIHCSREDGSGWVALDNSTDAEYARALSLKVLARRLAVRFGHATSASVRIDREW
jgi:hypothetical protein